jgi:hypothetical protein
MRAARTLTAIVGIAQGLIGIATLILAFLLYFNLLDVQAMLNVSVELLPLSLLILCVFGFFSLTSGFFLLYEG